MKTPKWSLFLSIATCSCGLAVIVSASSARAANNVYVTSGTSGSWDATTTWNPAVVPAFAAGDIASASINSTPITLSTAVTLGALKATHNFGIAHSGGVAFTMDGTGISADNNGFGNENVASFLNGGAGTILNVRPNIILNSDIDIGFVGASGNVSMAIGVATVNNSSITNGGNTDRNINFRLNSSGGNVTVSATIGANGSLSGGGTGTGLLHVRNIGTNGTGTVIISGNLTTGVGSVIQNSANSKMALSGTNSFDGTYTITSGALSFINRVSLFNADTSKWTAAKISVGANGILGLGYGAAANFSAAEIASLNSSDILTAGSRLGIDVSAAATYANAITNANGGATVTGFAKLGTAALTLEGNSSYGGVTNIVSGSLILGTGQEATTGALGNTSSIIFSGGTLQFSASNTYDYSSKFNTAGNPILINTGGQNVTFTSALTTGTAGTLGKAGSGTLTLTGNSTFGTAGSVSVNVTGGILRGSDSTVRTGNANLNRVFGVGVVQLAGGTTLELRANGTNDSSSQILTYGNQLQVSSGGVTYTVDVGREAATGGTGKTIALGSHNVGANNTMNVTGSNDFNLAINQLQIGGGGTSSVFTINPTTANVIIASVGSGSQTASPTLRLSGTSQGNVISGLLANPNATATNRTSVLKSGTSTWTLNGTNTYTGTTTIEAGTLVVNGSIAASTATSPTTVIQAAGTLAGTGTINNAVSISGIVAPGAPGGAAGRLTFNSSVAGTADFSAGGTLLWSITSLTDLEAAAGTDYDQLTLAGSLGLTLGGTSSLTVAFGGGAADPNSGDSFWNAERSWKIVNSTGSGTNAGSTNFSQITNANYSGGTFTTLADASGNVFLNFTPVPEPGTASLLAAALGLSLRRRRNA